MAIYWFSVARSLQWDEYVGRSPDFAREVVKAKTETEGIEKMTERILSIAGATSDVGGRLQEPVTHEEAVEWLKSAAKRNTEAGTLYPVCIDIHEREPGKLTPIKGRSVKQADMPGWWLLSRIQVPDEPVPYYHETRRGMPIFKDKYKVGYGPAAQLLTENTFYSRCVLLLRAVCGDAAREAARRIRLASEEGGPCLPRIAGILTVKEASLNMDEKRCPPVDTILEDTPAWLWQEEQPLNLMEGRHYGNSWLIVDRGMCWITDRILGVARQMTVEALLSTLEDLAEAMDRYQPELERSEPELFKHEAPEDGAEPLDKDREHPFFLEGGKRWICISRWEAAWEAPGNNYPCLVMPYPKRIGGQTGDDLKLVFRDAENVSEFIPGTRRTGQGQACRRVDRHVLPLLRACREYRASSSGQ